MRIRGQCVLGVHTSRLFLTYVYLKSALVSGLSVVQLSRGGRVDVGGVTTIESEWEAGKQAQTTRPTRYVSDKLIHVAVTIKPQTQYP